MLGEFSGFYFIVYYIMLVLLFYLVTFIFRIGFVRFWMFGIVIVNILVERFIIYVCISGLLVVNNSEVRRDFVCFFYLIKNNIIN